jgi:hypothetical protein
MFSQEELDRMEKEYHELGWKEKDIFNKFLIHIYQNNQERVYEYKNLENVVGELYIHKKIYGIEGGTCWDEPGEDNSHEVISGDKEVVNSLAYSVKSIIEQYLKPLNLDETKVKEWLDTNVRSLSKYSYVKEYFEAEYYGNSSTYGIYKIDLNSFIEHVCTDREKNFYKEVAENFVPPIKKKNSWGR